MIATQCKQSYTHMAARQATSEDVEKSDKVPVVLRVKRKRTDDPAESLGASVAMITNSHSMYDSTSSCMVLFFDVAVVKKLRRLDSSVAPQGENQVTFFKTHWLGFQ